MGAGVTYYLCVIGRDSLIFSKLLPHRLRIRRCFRCLASQQMVTNSLCAEGCGEEEEEETISLRCLGVCEWLWLWQL